MITGGTGPVGLAIRRALAEEYSFRIFDVVAPQHQAVDDELILGDAADYATLVEAAKGVDAIIHLARASVKLGSTTQAQRAQKTFQTDMPSTWNALEAARINGVGSVIYASSNHVTGLHESEGAVSGPDSAVRPDGMYGAGKAFGEAIGRYYSETQGVRVYCLRIANFNGKDEPGKYYAPGYSRWLSPRDLGQLTRLCLEADQIRFGIFYGVSNGSEKKFDINNARELLGYAPEDDGSAESWRAKYQEKFSE